MENKFSVICLVILNLFLSACTTIKSTSEEKEAIMTQEKKMLPYVVINDENCQNRNILTKSAEEVKFPLSKKDREIVELLTYQFRNEENCAGLAAPQIGFSKRIIIFSVPEEVQNYRVDATSVIPETLLINPVFKSIGNQKTLDWEACFSVSDYGGEVERFIHIHYDGFDVSGNKVEGEAIGFPARLIQHEIGHLNGQLFIHLLKPNARQGNLEKIREIHRSELAAKKETYVSTQD